MNTFLFSNGLRRLFGFSAIVAVAVCMLALSGCGHSCHCNRSSGCSTCSTCGVSDNSQPSCPTCATCQGTSTAPSSYDRVGQAPASLSEPLSIQTQTQPSAYPSTSSYPTNTSLDRPGESRDLPLFSKPVAQPTVRASETPENAFPALAKQPAATILPPQTGAAQTHTLQKGETIYALSRQYGVKPKAILDANHFSDPNHLSVGTQVIIPAN